MNLTMGIMKRTPIRQNKRADGMSFERGGALFRNYAIDGLLVRYLQRYQTDCQAVGVLEIISEKIVFKMYKKIRK